MKTVLDMQRYKNKNQKISMITCYDYTSAKILNASDIDILLVGDSLAQVIYGFPNTLHATVPMMVSHTSAVSRGAPHKFLVADMPFLSTRKGLQSAVESAGLLMTSGAQAVKIEGGREVNSCIEYLVASGIPVMGHLGLTPQFFHQLGGHKVQGRSDAAADKILEDAILLEKAGCFSIVLECIPSKLAKKITEVLEIPTIGIGAGQYTSGQVLVFQDMLGMQQDFHPKFLKVYETCSEKILSAVNKYAAEVSLGHFPAMEHAYE